MPNTTQIPHIIIREWMPVLKDIELRILLVVADQTLGWIEDVETKRRKDKDWISHYQLRTKIKKKGGRIAGDRSVSQAIANMADKLKIIETLNEKGVILASPHQRMKNGGKIYYRLNLHSPQKSLFGTPAKKDGGYVNPRTNRPPSKLTSYKRNLSYKRNTFVDEKTSTNKSPERLSKYWDFLDMYKKVGKKMRGVSIKIDQIDGKNLNRVLDFGFSIETLEKLAVYFLSDRRFKKFSPKLSTFLSYGVQVFLQNLMHNNPYFWSELDKYSTSAFHAVPDAKLLLSERSKQVKGTITQDMSDELATVILRLEK